MQADEKQAVKLEQHFQEDQLIQKQLEQENYIQASDFQNSQGMRMLKMEAGTFKMGGGNLDFTPLSLPVHEVTLTRHFYISQEPVTVKQFAAYEREAFGTERSHQEYRGYLLGVSYEEASSYTDWLTKKEGRPYHLPTEAQWEYAARLSSRLPIDRMCDSHIREWCFDWYSPYDDRPAEDPAGAADGMFRCVRGGYLDNPARLNDYPLDVWYRCAMPPSYSHNIKDTNNAFGLHPIGFRVVMGDMPAAGRSQRQPLMNVGVHQRSEDYRAQGPDPMKPYFRKRYLFPVPPDNCTGEEIRAAGFPAAFRHHHHSPGFAAAANGDLLYTAYSTYNEYDAQSGLAGTRLRAGEDQWELPDMFLPPTGVNDHAPLLDTAPDGTIRHFWGWPQLDHAYPFQYIESTDNGEHWGPVQFPLFRNKAMHVVAQPVNTCIHGRDGTFYLVSDSSLGSSSVLWRSPDGLKTWENPAGRTAGRHTTAVELKDGSILAMGGKNSDIEGCMPAAVTRDKGESYEVYKSCFPALGSGQRPSILRLASGRLVFCGDYQTKTGAKPKEFTESGSYVAWSDDEGKTWKRKNLWGAQRRKKTPDMFGGASTLGYSAMKQGTDGLIHVVCSNVQPLLHLCFNEAWLLDETGEEPSEKELMQSSATRLVSERREYTEYYDSGQLKCRYHGGIADDGRFLLDGEETFWYPNGQMMLSGSFLLGRRTGQAVCYDEEGFMVKRFTCPDAVTEDLEEWYETFWEGSNQVKTKAFFRNRKAEGEAFTWNREGVLVRTVNFSNGKIL